MYTKSQAFFILIQYITDFLSIQITLLSQKAGVFVRDIQKFFFQYTDRKDDFFLIFSSFVYFYNYILIYILLFFVHIRRKRLFLCFILLNF
nr:MAG TPA: hypothetical protein [Caudoviricetes sp.]